MARRILWILMAVVLVAAGCFPILLDVDKKGRVLIPRPEGVYIYDTQKDTCQLLARAEDGFTPAWARWSGNGRMVLLGAVSESGRQCELSVIDVRSKRSKSYGKFKGLACAFWSPEGRAISIGELQDDDTCNIAMINLLNGQKVDLLSRSLPMHRWLPGGRLVAFSVTAAQPGGDAYFGEIVIISIKRSVTMDVIAQASCEKASSIDVTDDGKYALVAEWSPMPGYKLTRIDLTDGSKKTLIDRNVLTAFWSPDGQHIAVVRTVLRDANEDKKTDPTPEGEPPRQWRPGQDAMGQLVVTDAEGQNPKVLANHVTTHTGNSWETWTRSRPVYPTWADNETVLYFEEACTWGTAGRAMRLMSTKIDGSERRCLQGAIDEAVAHAPTSSRTRRR